MAALVVAMSMATPTPWVLGLNTNELRTRQAHPDIQRLCRDLDATLVLTLPRAIVVSIPAPVNAAALLTRFPNLRYAAQDALLPVDLRWIPDDPLFPDEWHLQAGLEASLDGPTAWNTSLGQTEFGPVPVAVIDDGIDLQHADLTQNLAPQGYDVSHLPPDDDPSYNGAERHGTEVAGVIAAQGNNNLGLSGVCPACQILPVRLLGNGGPSDLFTSGSAIASAITWAVDHGAWVINNSWGPPDGNPLDPAHPVESWALPDVVADAFQYAATQGRAGLGTAMVFSAGNGGELASYDGFASDPRVLAVGAIDQSGARAYYSDFGPSVRLVAPSSGMAPGSGIPTTDLSGTAGAAAGDYLNDFGGTSAAAAVASGAIALLLAHAPTLTLAQTLELLFDTAYPVDAARGSYLAGVSRWYGYGRVDPAAALAEAARYPDEHTLWFELCGNDLDDDGNGTIDDPERCARCVPDYPEELCDGRDNNCDGQIDELFVCMPRDRPLCAPCSDSRQCREGLLCRSGGLLGTWCLADCADDHPCPDGFTCAAATCSPTQDATHRNCYDFIIQNEPERCDGLDNDGNTQVDDVAPTSLEARMATKNCGTQGVCAEQAASCVDGRWLCPRTEVFEPDETRCDNLDNDCYGEVDEATACQPQLGGGCTGCQSTAIAPAPYTALMLLTWVRRRRR